ncbi:MAG TPA: AAA family ATPase [Burkholderiales bacterium]|nr:AAA family ATPase [Burkholderiales bacterium]
MNYLGFLGLREPPFGITPDTSFYFPFRSTQEALNTLLVAVQNGEGFIKITGEVGMGKTLLCRKFLATLQQHDWVSAYIPNPHLEPRSLLLVLAEELGAKADPGADEHTVLRGLNRRLLDVARNRKRVVLCMDEVQAMPLETLETLRLLTNLETEKRKLLQVVLFGQPELDQRLATGSIRQLRQRITFHHEMGGMNEEEVGGYFAHRMRVAGYSGPALLSGAARRELARASRGVPRLVNILAHKALLLLYGEGGSRLETRHVRMAAHDTPSASRSRRWWQWMLPAGSSSE